MPSPNKEVCTALFFNISQKQSKTLLDNKPNYILSIQRLRRFSELATYAEGDAIATELVSRIAAHVDILQYEFSSALRIWYSKLKF